MLESMCENSRPTRAEASDVYNAVIDGADAVMLSGESSVGKWPVEAVTVMNEIVREAQGNMPHRHLTDYDSVNRGITETVCHAACTIAKEFSVFDFQGKIVVITKSGRAARLISKYRPALPILAFSDSVRVVRELCLVWGVRSHFYPEIEDLSVEDRVIKSIEVALEIGYLSPEDKKVCVLTPSVFAGTGYLTGVYDVESLIGYAKASKISKNIRASMI